MNFIKAMILILILTFQIWKSRASTKDCILNIQFPSQQNDSNCDQSSNWGRFLEANCCVLPFDGYLQALGERANKTGQIFLNETEQVNCLSSMNTKKDDVLNCGIQKLTSGKGGCSDYSVFDVSNKLGMFEKSLEESCNLGHDDLSGEACGSCLKKWGEIREDYVCRFAVLVAVTSRAIYEKKWIEKVYGCLQSQNFAIMDIQGSEIKNKINRKDLWILIGCISGIVIVMSIVSCIILRRKAKSKFIDEKKDDESIEYYPSDDKSICRKISIKEVNFATGNLNISNFIGQGIAGKVYKGILSNGQHVAIKHILNDGHMETFVREVTSLSPVKHPNLVLLVGYCEGDGECFLVYELCRNGNLSEWLFGKEKTLTWIQRLQIAIDCARGLWFLHTYPDGCIVHRDIKPTNILICEDFHGKLSDFGLSKVIDMGLSYVSSEVRGTFGYVDPEYQKNRRVNSSGDVYSFGIVLLQILSGQRVINMDLSRPMSLDKKARFLTRGGNLVDFVDAKLNGDYSIEAFEIVMKLALSCTGLKQERPGMEQIVAKLEHSLDISINS